MDRLDRESTEPTTTRGPSQRTYFLYHTMTTTTVPAAVFIAPAFFALLTLGATLFVAWMVSKE